MKDLKVKGISNMVIATALATALLSAGPAMAASACKGMEDKACNTSDECSWVNGYERKDGKKVKSFCRSKPKSKQKAKS